MSPLARRGGDAHFAFVMWCGGECEALSGPRWARQAHLKSAATREPAVQPATVPTLVPVTGKCSAFEVRMGSR